jgi:hypothetical protein
MAPPSVRQCGCKNTWYRSEMMQNSSLATVTMIEHAHHRIGKQSTCSALAANWGQGRRHWRPEMTCAQLRPNALLSCHINSTPHRNAFLPVSFTLACSCWAPQLAPNDAGRLGVRAPPSPLPGTSAAQPSLPQRFCTQQSCMGMLKSAAKGHCFSAASAGGARCRQPGNAACDGRKPLHSIANDSAM